MIVHRVDRDLHADFRHARHVDRDLHEVRLRDEIRVLSRDVFPLLHIAVRLFERLCDRDLIVADARIMERVDDIFKLNIRDNRGHNPLHERHLRNHPAPHLPRADNTRTDDFALFLALGEFLVHIQHRETPFARLSAVLSSDSSALKYIIPSISLQDNNCICTDTAHKNGTAAPYRAQPRYIVGWMIIYPCRTISDKSCRTHRYRAAF